MDFPNNKKRSYACTKTVIAHDLQIALSTKSDLNKILKTFYSFFIKKLYPLVTEHF